MPIIRDLQQYISILRSEGELREIHIEVDPYLEAAEIHRRVIAEGGPALLFKRIKGSPFPLATNLFGTSKRIDLAFGSRPEDLVRQIAKLPEELMPPSVQKLWQHRSLFFDLSKIGLKRQQHGSILSNRNTPAKLDSLPLLTTWEKDGGPFITLPLVYTQHPKTHQHNLGMYRIQRYDTETTGLHCQIGKGGGFHLAAARDLGEKLPVNIFVGGPPALTLSAIAPLPENVPELLLASLALGEKLKLCDNPSGPLPLVSDAEFALVGEVDPLESRLEGPFGDHYGYYSLAHDYPVFRCKALFHRPNAVFAATVVGKPRQEDFYLGDYLQHLLSPLFPLVMPAVRDLWSYGETGYHSLTAAVVYQRYKREAMASAFRILGEGQLSLTKFLLLIDRPMDLKNFAAVLEYVLERADFRTDLYLFSNLSMDTLDYNGPQVNEGSKGVLLGVGEPIRDLPAEYHGTLPGFISRAIPFCRGCLVVESRETMPDLPQQIAKANGLSDWPLIVLVDDASAATKTSMAFLWTTFTRFEPGGDIYASKSELAHNHLSYTAPIVIDARLKPGFPDELECDPKTSELVTKRWHQY